MADSNAQGQTGVHASDGNASTQQQAEGGGPGTSPVGVIGIVVLTVVMAGVTVLLIYLLLLLWPGSPAEHPVVTVFGLSIWITDERRLLFLVLLAGALGSQLHSLRSIYWYIGNRELKWSWVAMYLLLPFAGATLALIFYFVVRGGFFSPQSSFSNTSPFGFAAFAGLIGMFSQQAVLKLQSVAETIFTRPEPGKDAKPQKTAEEAGGTGAGTTGAESGTKGEGGADNEGEKKEEE